MSNQEKGLSIYSESLLSDSVQNDLNSGSTPDDNYFIQGVFDNVHSLLSNHFSEEEMEDIEIGDILDDYHFS